MTELEVVAHLASRMAFAVACGCIVGVERKVNDASAGFKTQILVCVGAMLFTTVPYVAGIEAEAGRVIGQIASGVGFLGAGAILHTRSTHVLGLTTAAWIWFTAAVGVFIGVGHGAVALFVTASLVGVITIARAIEHFAFRHHHGATEQAEKQAA